MALSIGIALSRVVASRDLAGGIGEPGRNGVAWVEWCVNFNSSLLKQNRLSNMFFVGRVVIPEPFVVSIDALDPRLNDRNATVWRLVSFEQKLPDGRAVFPYGEKSVGRITYDNAGRMSAQLLRPGRRSAVTPAGALIDGKASGEEIGEAVDGFLAYFGAFDVDESSQTVIHHIEACLIPSWVGTDLKRTYRFNGNRLVLTTGGAGESLLELVWERERD